MSATKYCPDPDSCNYSDCPTAFCDRNASTHSPAPSGSDALGELRESKPTTYLIWDDGVLNQLWQQHWARWDGNHWYHWTVEVWKPVPTKRQNAPVSAPGANKKD